MTGSPLATVSPTLTSHSDIVPSVIDSASSGTIISFIKNFLPLTYESLLLQFVLESFFVYLQRRGMVMNGQFVRYIVMFDHPVKTLLLFLRHNPIFPFFSALLVP